MLGFSFVMRSVASAPLDAALKIEACVFQACLALLKHQPKL